MTILQAIRAVQVFQDKRWIPEELHDRTYFGRADVWHYISISDDRRCKYCEEFDGYDYFGDQLQTFFPDMNIRSRNVIDVHIHKTLWGKDTCRCKLVRVALEPEDVEKIKEEKLSEYVKEKLELEPHDANP